MAICLFCRKAFPKNELFKLRNNNYVCKTCIKSRVSILNDILIEKLDLEHQKNKIINLHEKIAFYFSIIIIIFGLLWIHNSITTSYIYFFLFLCLSWIVFSIIIKFKKNKISLKGEKINEKENTIVPQIKEELNKVYEKFYGYPPDWHERRTKVYNREKGICQNCNKEIKGTFHIHHKIPKSKEEGNHRLDNLILLCPKCHSKIGSPGHNMIKRSKKKVRRGG